MIIKKLRDLLDRREASAPELANAYIDMIDARDGALHAYLHVNRDGVAKASAGAQARIDAGEQTLFTGIPLALDDNLCTEDMPATCGSRMLDGFRPLYDASAVAKLRAQDAVFLGKLNTDEFSMGAATMNSYYGRTANPYERSYVSGVASGGAASAVAAGLCAAAIGVDAGGSVCLPAAFCGVTGLRPTFGYVSRSGVAAYASCFDQAGPVATDADDCAALLAAVSGYCPKDMTTAPLKGVESQTDTARYASNFDVKGLKIGLIRELLDGAADARVARAVRKAAEWFERAGAVVTETSIPALRDGVTAFYLIACAEASANLARIDGVRYGRRAEGAGNYFDIISKSRGEGLGLEAKRQILFGTGLLSKAFYDKYYRRAVLAANIIRAQYASALQSADMLLSPAVLTPPYKADQASSPFYLPDICQVGPSLAGLPAAVTPCGYIDPVDPHKDGSGAAPRLQNGAPAAALPIAFMLTGKRFGDFSVLGAVRAYEMDFDRRQPAVCDGRKGWI